MTGAPVRYPSLDELAPGGCIFINVPINSPAPDPIHDLSSPEECAELEAAAALEVLTASAFPVAGYSLERAERLRFTVSCCLIATVGRC